MRRTCPTCGRSCRVTEDAAPAAGAIPATRVALDARLLIPAATVWLAAFVTTGSPPAVAPGWLALMGCLGVAVLALVASTALAARGLRGTGAPSSGRRLLALGVLGLLGGGLVGSFHLQAVRGSGLAELAQKRATMTGGGVVTADPAVARGRHSRR